MGNMGSDAHNNLKLEYKPRSLGKMYNNSAYLSYFQVQPSSFEDAYGHQNSTQSYVKYQMLLRITQEALLSLLTNICVKQFILKISVMNDYNIVITDAYPIRLETN